MTAAACAFTPYASSSPSDTQATASASEPATASPAVEWHTKSTITK